VLDAPPRRDVRVVLARAVASELADRVSVHDGRTLAF